MKHLLLAFTVLFSLQLFAQAPTITSVEPDRGPSTGGTEVTITGTNFLHKVLCILPCPAQVAFGGTIVPVKSESDTKLVVVTPAHAPGTVDVEVLVAGENPVSAEDAFTFTEDQDDRYERALLPIYVDSTVNGAFGSQWRTDFWIRNNGPSSGTVAPWPCPEGMACPPIYPPQRHFLPGDTVHNLPALFRAPNANPSRVLYLDDAPGGNFSLGLRVFDVSRATLNAGTEIPVIRDKELLDRTSQLFNVPMDDRFRVLLRVYELEYTNASFTVRMYDQASLTGGVAPIHQFTLTATTAQTGLFRTEAAYAQFDVTSLLQLDDKQWPAAVRIEIEPTAPGGRYWAFASLTNNDTQLVTVVSPQ